MNSSKILAIDDERHVRNLIQSEFALEGLQVVTAKDGEEGLKALGGEEFDLVLLDLRLPRMDGMEVLVHIKDRVPAMPVIMVTGYGDIQTAVESMKRGAFNYITKPFKFQELLALARQAIECGRSASDACSPSRAGGHPRAKEPREQFILCPSEGMQQVYALVERVGATDKTILLEGETGVGKDVLAQHIHLRSNRRNGPFVCVEGGCAGPVHLCQIGRAHV